MTARRFAATLLVTIAAWAALAAFVLMLAGCHRLLHWVGGP